MALRQHLEGGILDVHDSAQIQHDDSRIVSRDGDLDLVGNLLGIEEEETPFRPQNEQAFNRFVVRMLRSWIADILPAAPLKTERRSYTGYS